MSDRCGPRVVPPVPLGVGGDWSPVTAGESGASVFRAADATRYAKCVPATDATGLEAERDRIAWLSGQGVPGPRILDWYAAGDGLCRTTRSRRPAGARWTQQLPQRVSRMGK